MIMIYSLEWSSEPTFDSVYSMPYFIVPYMINHNVSTRVLRIES